MHKGVIRILIEEHNATILSEQSGYHFTILVQILYVDQLTRFVVTFATGWRQFSHGVRVQSLSRSKK